MKGQPRVIQLLNEYLRIELTGHKQYLLWSAMCANWGYEKLRAAQEAYSHEETAHSARVVRRILFLEGTPELHAAASVAPVAGVREQLEADHALVSRAIAQLRGAVTVCMEEADGVTRNFFEEMLVDEEKHLDWVETELSLIEQLGLQLYLQQQMRG